MLRIIFLLLTVAWLISCKEGELCISAAQLMLGYYQNKKETDEVIFVDNGVKWLKTHDLATISPDGIVKITGRIKRIYSRLTQDGIQTRVYPMRIEECISVEPAIEKCAVVGIKDDKTAYRTIAYMIPKEDNKDHESLKGKITERCKANLPESHIPDEYIFVSDFPLTRAGKVDYRTLEEMATSI